MPSRRRPHAPVNPVPPKPISPVDPMPPAPHPPSPEPVTPSPAPGTEGREREPQPQPAGDGDVGAALANEAERLLRLNIPYVWGGSSLQGADCSGLTAMIVRNVTGRDITHDSHAQMNLGTPVERDALRPADLLFYDTAGGSEVREGNRASHVGIYVAPGRMVNALNEQDGIKASDPFSSYFAPLFLGARRLFDAPAPQPQPQPAPVPQPAPTPARSATITLDTPYLEIGNYPAAIWDRDIPRTSPLYAIRHELRAIGDAANLGALLFEQLRKESSFANDASAQQSHNPLGLMIRDPKTEPFILVANGQRKLRVFATYQDAPREYVRRLTDPTEAYQSVGVKTLGELIERYLMGWIPGNPNRPFPPGETAESARLYKQQVLDRIVTEFASVPTPTPTPTPDPKPVPTPPAKPNMTKGLIPMPPYTKRIITPQMKPEGIGWNNLGPRQPWGMSRHRMQGTLWGTDSFFHDATVKALTDFGIDHQTGEMLQWCDPFGTMTPWASGPVSAPYGDGAAFLAKWEAKYGKDVVNRMRVSLEIAGYFAQPGSSITADSPWSDISKHRFAQALAHFAHDHGIVWSDFPIAPDDGFSFLCDHIEFTKGTGKICPGVLVQKATDEVIQLAQDIMKAAQGGSVKPPVPTPTIVYPDGMDRDLAADLFGRVESNGITYTYNETGPVSRLWLDLGMTHQPHEFPRLERVVQSATGPDYFFFDGGRTLYRKDDNAAFVVLGDNPMDASRKAA